MDIINSLLITPSVTILYFEYPRRICINERTSMIAKITARNISIKLKLKTGELILNILSQNWSTYSTASLYNTCLYTSRYRTGINAPKRFIITVLITSCLPIVFTASSKGIAHLV